MESQCKCELKGLSFIAIALALHHHHHPLPWLCRLHSPGVITFFRGGSIFSRLLKWHSCHDFLGRSLNKVLFSKFPGSTHVNLSLSSLIWQTRNCKGPHAINSANAGCTRDLLSPKKIYKDKQ